LETGSALEQRWFHLAEQIRTSKVTDAGSCSRSASSTSRVLDAFVHRQVESTAVSR
jgi:hypothetical protein